MQRALLFGTVSEDDGLERGSWETGRRGLACRWLADRISDAHGAEAADGRHLARGQGVASWRTRRREHPDRAGLGLLLPAHQDALARTEGAREETDIRDPLAR